MNAFEELVASLFRREGYWTFPSYKVVLTKEEKKQVNRPSMPRMEIDLLAYRTKPNTLVWVECKSYLDSPGVQIVAMIVAGVGDLGVSPAEAASSLFVSPTGSGAACTSGKPCSFTQALTSAATGDTIELFSGTYFGTFVVPSVTLEAASGQSGPVVLSGERAGSVLTVDSGETATIDGLTITDGTSHGGGLITNGGGGLLNDGTVTVEDSTISHNSAEIGGGIYNKGTLTVENSTISANTGSIYGGGIFNFEQGTATVKDSTISGNSATLGGGIDNYSTGVATIEDSTISGNTTLLYGDKGEDGGGIYNRGTTTVEDSTISENTAGELTRTVGLGGGIYNEGDTITVEASTISANMAAAGRANDIYNTTGTVVLAADLLSKPGGPQAEGSECGGMAVQDDGYNVQDDGTCNLIASTSLSFSVVLDYYVGGLGGYGGPTQTVPLLASTPFTSERDPALGVVPSTFDLPNKKAACSVPDQRGVARSAPCDVGSFELVPTTTALEASTTTPEVGQQVTYTATVSPAPDGGSVTFYDGGKPIACTNTGGQTVNTSTGVATCQATYGSTVGSPHSITSTYSGDTNYAQSSTTSATIVTVSPLATTTTPSVVTSGPHTYGQSITYSATVESGSGTPDAGTVTFKVGSTTLCSGLVDSGTASCSATNTPVGLNQAVEAKFSGTSIFGSSSGSTNITVAQATPTKPTISNLPASGGYGGGFTATVSTNGDGIKSVTSNSTSVCTASGLVVKYVGVGTCSLTAHVGIGTDYTTANGSAQTFTVTKATPTKPTISNLPASGGYGGGFTATVSTNGDGIKSVTSNSTSVCTASGLVVKYVGVGTCSLTAHVGIGTDYTTANGSAQTFTVTKATTGKKATPTSGYDLVGRDGGVFVFSPPGTTGGFYGSLPGMGETVNNIVGMVPTTTDHGYFLVGSDGGVFAFGNAPFLGSLPGLQVTPAQPITGIVAANTDKGYFLVGRDGGVFAFGTVPFLGSLPGRDVWVNNIIGIASTPSGNGYWLVSATGTVYGFGAAQQLGTAKGTSSPVSAIAGTPTGGGYWITTQSGAVHAFGNAKSFGTLPALHVTPALPVIGVVHTADTAGYWLIGSDGGIFAFGDAGFVGSLPGVTVHVSDVVGAVPITGE